MNLIKRGKVTVEPTLEALATAAATALAKAIGTRAWDEVRPRFAKLFGRGDKRRTDLAEGRLDAAAASVTTAEDAGTARDSVAQQWQTRLIDLLEESPDRVGELAELIRQMGQEINHGSGPVQINIGAGSSMMNAVQGGNMYNQVVSGARHIDDW
jgi:hypothetical protein